MTTSTIGHYAAHRRRLREEAAKLIASSLAQHPLNSSWSPMDVEERAKRQGEAMAAGLARFDQLIDERDGVERSGHADEYTHYSRDKKAGG